MTIQNREKIVCQVPCNCIPGGYYIDGKICDKCEGTEWVVCPECAGTGRVAADERNEEGNWRAGVGMQKCENQLEK